MTYVHIPNQKRSKLDDKGEKHVFVAYDACYKKTMVSTDVVFDEEASRNWNDEPKDYNFFFLMIMISLVALLLHQHYQHCQSLHNKTHLRHLGSSSEGPRSMRSLRDIYDETKELKSKF